jgi:hypothetical protein
MLEWIRQQLRITSKDQGEAPPNWDAGSQKLKVLVETNDRAERWAITEELKAAGFDTVSCGGPYSLHGGECALVAGGGCPAAAGADAIFHRLNPANPSNREVLVALKRTYPETPIVVEIPQPDLRRFSDALDGCNTVLMPADAPTMVAAIRRAVRAPIAPSPTSA